MWKASTPLPAAMEFDLPDSLPGSPPKPAAARPEILTVSQLNQAVARLLERSFPLAWISGEISNFTRAASGHWYFTLKDAGAQVRAVMFRGRAQYVDFAPREGDKIEVRATVSLYAPRGDFQLNVETMRRAGVGNLYEAFLQLKAKLAAEGLFEPSRKRELPAFPRTVGIVTSPQAAALRDMITAFRRRAPHVQLVLYPTLVQGDGAAMQIAQAIATASARAECDLLIVGRGGGSLEDLWCFNDERVARAIAACPVPVISGVGHETDFTIADFVADLRAPTPSGAAELVVPDGAAWRLGFERLGLRLAQAMRRQLRNDGDYLTSIRRRLALAHPGQRLRQNAQRLDELEQRLASRIQLLFAERRHRLQSMTTRLARMSPVAAVQRLAHRHALLDTRLRRALPQRLDALRQRLSTLARTLDAVSPLATLDRGFALVTRVSDGALLHDATNVRSGDLIDARLARGSIRARVVDPSEGEKS